MARPNYRIPSNSASKRYHKDLIKLIEAWKMVRFNAGQKFVSSASDVDMSKDFAEHYWRMAGFTKIGKEMLRCYKRIK